MRVQPKGQSQSGARRTVRDLLTRASAKALIGVGLLVPVILIAVPTFRTYQLEREITNSFGLVTYTMEVKGMVQTLYNKIVEAETAERGYLLTRRADFLAPYHAGLSQVKPALEKLRTLTSDNASQQLRLQKLEPHIDERLKLMAKGVAKEESGNHVAALSIVADGPGRGLMTKIREELRAMDEEQDRLLLIRQGDVSLKVRGSTELCAVLVGLSALCGAAVIYLLRRLSKLRPLVRMCAWSNTIEYEGEWLSIDEYLRRRFHLSTTHGISPEQFKKLAPKSKTGRRLAA